MVSRNSSRLDIEGNQPVGRWMLNSKTRHSQHGSSILLTHVRHVNDVQRVKRIHFTFRQPRVLFRCILQDAFGLRRAVITNLCKSTEKQHACYAVLYGK